MTTADEPLGTAGHEASRLFESLKEWLDARGLAEVPLATGSAECRACPICLALSALRDHNPEVVDQLGKAADALMAAIRSVVSDHEHRWASGRAPDVERIDIDE